MTTIDTAQAPPDLEPAQPAGDPRDGLAYLIRTSARGFVPRKVRVDCGMCPAGSRDTECKIHGVDVDPAWWRTPAHLREDGDMTHPTPALTPREVALDAILVRDEDMGRWRS